MVYKTKKSEIVVSNQNKTEVSWKLVTKYLKWTVKDQKVRKKGQIKAVPKWVSM